MISTNPNAYTYSYFNITYNVTKAYPSLGKLRIELPSYPGSDLIHYKSFKSFTPQIFSYKRSKYYQNEYCECYGSSSQLQPGQIIKLEVRYIRNPDYPMNITGFNVTLYDMEGYAL